MLPKFEYKSLRLQDLEWARNFRNQEDTRIWLGSFSKIGFFQQLNWFRKLLQDKSKKRLVVFQDKQKIGIVRIDSIDKENKSLCLGLDILPSYRGKGWAQLIYRDLLDHYFALGYNRIWLFVLSYNHRAIHLYKKLNFQIEGMQRQAIYRDNQYHDYIMMSLLKEEWHNDPVNESTRSP